MPKELSLMPNSTLNTCVLPKQVHVRVFVDHRCANGRLSERYTLSCESESQLHRSQNPTKRTCQVEPGWLGYHHGTSGCHLIGKEQMAKPKMSL